MIFTGTLLNIRDDPKGRITNALSNGTDVYIDEIAYDSKGRPLAKQHCRSCIEQSELR